MATSQLKLDRQQLATFLPTPEAIKAFENLFIQVIDVIPNEMDNGETQINIIQTQAIEALNSLSEVINSLSFALLTNLKETPKEDFLILPTVIQQFDLPFIPPLALGTLSELNGGIGIYTPTLTNVANLTASAAYPSQWVKVDNVVTVSGRVDIDPLLAATLTQLGISLPVASNLAFNYQCCGAAVASGIAAQSAAILGDVANDRAQMQWVSGDISNQPMYYTFTYRVI